MRSPARAAALAALRGLAAGRSFAETLDDDALGALALRDRGLARALAFGVARERRLLDGLLDLRLDRPLTGRARRLRPVLQLGLFQLGWLRVEDHAAVHETVGLLKDRRERGLVNAVLRRYQRDGAPRELPGAPAAVVHSHPDWLPVRFEADWGSEAEVILAANQREAPLWLRIDPRHGSPAAWTEAMTAAGGTVLPGLAPTMLRLADPLPVDQLPGFDRGWVTVQDGAAQLAAPLLPDLGSGRVLDACAAPGGKALHLQALQPAARLLALDVDRRRVQRMEANFTRCGARIETRCADAAVADGWWDGRPFAAIVLDAPCSGTGVIRRHPDIKWLRRAADLEALAALQDRLLDALWPLLEPGGTLLYCTCSILREENDRRIDAFLSRHPEARIRPPTLPVGRAAGAGWQVLPGEEALDGFFYARLERP